MSDRNIILIAEKNQKDREAIKNILDDKYEIVETDNGNEFMEFIYKNSESILLIIFNVSMTFVNGFDIMERLNTEGVIYQTPVIIILEDDDSYQIEKYGNEMGISDYIVKPFNIPIVKNRIFNVINLHETKNYLEFLVENQTMQLYKKNLELMEQREKVYKVNEAVIEIIGTIIEHRNTESNNHIKRIKLFTNIILKLIAKKYPEYRLDDKKINLIVNASAMHDIGKIVMPDSILLKPGKITEAEFEILKQHTVKGGEILKKLGVIENDEYFKYCYEICMYHHERWDGNGYPKGLSGDDIPISAQVVGLADVYDSITNDTVYRKKIDLDKAVAMILNGECGKFSDKIINCFKQVIKSYDMLSKQYVDDENNVIDMTDEEIKLTEKKKAFAFNKFANIDSSKFIFALTEQFDIVFETNQTGSNIVFYSVLDNSKYIKQEPKSYNELFMTIQKKCHPDDFEVFVEKFSIDNINDRARAGEFKNEAEIRLLDDNGKYNWIHISFSSFVNDYLEPESIIVCAKNINHIKEKESSLIFNVCHDSVTKLWNSNYMQEYISSFVDSFDRDEKLGLIVIDIDKFRNINKTYGYKFGNYILLQIAGELRTVFSSNDVIGRLGGDIFIIFVKDIDFLESKVKKLKENIFRVYSVDNNSIEISGGIGISIYPENGDTYEILLQKAECAVKSAKQTEEKYFFFQS